MALIKRISSLIVVFSEKIQHAVEIDLFTDSKLVFNVTSKSVFVAGCCTLQVFYHKVLLSTVQSAAGTTPATAFDAETGRIICSNVLQCDDKTYCFAYADQGKS
jgi:hypothetical protein